tara:strand:- start:251 stop:457 length:207 start_codon:yes stop_codon:yes gene_type:complete
LFIRGGFKALINNSVTYRNFKKYGLQKSYTIKIFTLKITLKNLKIKTLHIQPKSPLIIEIKGLFSCTD